MPIVPIDNVLDHLDRVKKASKGWIASCPTPLHVNGDRSRGLSIGEGYDGQVLLYCHAGCSTEEILESAGLEWADLFPDDPSRTWYTAPPAEKLFQLPRELVVKMLATDEWLLTWTVGRLLAYRHPIQAQRDLLMSWDHLNTLGVNIPLAWETAKMIQGVAFLRYGHAARCNTPDEVAAEKIRCVRRLLEAVDRDNATR